MKNSIEKLTEAMAESYDYQVISNHLFYSCTPYELIEVLKLLIEKYENQHNLLTTFFQSSSDACFLEANDMEKLENDFKSFVLNQNK